jgi:outer membrane protein TolC
VAEQLRQGNEAKIKAAASWATLSRRFPGIERKVVDLPIPSAELGQYDTWRERILAESDVLRRVEASLLRNQGQSARAKADRVPDPTLGVFTASEQGNRERIYGVSFSMPIPSGSRSVATARRWPGMRLARMSTWPNASWKPGLPVTSNWLQVLTRAT